MNVLALGSVGVLLWTYLLFPLVTMLLGAVRPRSVAGADVTPSLAVVIAAHNEEGSIGAKLDNVLAADYPRHLLDVVVAADGCTDGTREQVDRRAGSGVRLLDLKRVGKAQALNRAVATCTADVLVFSDANSMLAGDALRALVRPFADPQVGGVAGDQVYLPAAGESAEGAGERSYWSLDRLLKRAESRAGNVISATGALYAIRREHFQPVVDGVTDDFFVSTAVVAAGRRLVFAADAHVHEPVAASDGLEYGRKVRVMTRGLRGVQARRDLLDIRQHGYYSVQLLSHKVLRRLMAAPLLTLLMACLARAPRSRVHRAAAAVQVAGYATGAAGLLLARRTRTGPEADRRRAAGFARKALAVPAYFLMVNTASLHASWNVLRGRRIVRWEPQRAVFTSEASGASGAPGAAGAASAERRP